MQYTKTVNHPAHQLTEEEVLEGIRFDDAIANGTYRVDIHHSDQTGITFKYLDGRQEFARQGFPQETSRWKPEGSPYARFYQIPYRSLVPQNPSNMILAGRTIDGDRGAFAALRVMVNTNQTGEAAGVAAWLMLDKSKSFANVDGIAFKRSLHFSVVPYCTFRPVFTPLGLPSKRLAKRRTKSNMVRCGRTLLY